jgi:protein-tyrosine-phosphatase
MAAALFKAQLARAGLEEEWRVESAGTWALEGQPATDMARTVMRERGLDLEGHRSRPVSPELLAQFDLILVMDTGHQEALRVEFPGLAERVHLLTAMVGPGYSVPDPIGEGLETYRALAEELAGLLDGGFERIRSLVG